MTIKVGPTRQRLIAAAAILIAATTILAIAGIDLRAYLMGVGAGIAIVLLLVWFGFYRKRGERT